MGTLEKIPASQLTEVKNKSEVIAEARNKGHTVHSSQKFGVGDKTPKIQRSSCALR